MQMQTSILISMYIHTKTYIYVLYIIQFKNPLLQTCSWHETEHIRHTVWRVKSWLQLGQKFRSVYLFLVSRDFFFFFYSKRIWTVIVFCSLLQQNPKLSWKPSLCVFNRNGFLSTESQATVYKFPGSRIDK